MATSKQNQTGTSANTDTSPKHKPDILLSFDEVKYNIVVKEMEERAQGATILTTTIKREFNFNPSKEAILGVIAGDSGTSFEVNPNKIAEELKSAIQDQLGGAGVGRLVSESVFDAGMRNLFTVINEHRQHYPRGVNALQYDFDGDTWTVKQSVKDQAKASLSNIIDTPQKHAIHEAQLEYAKATQALFDAIKGGRLTKEKGLAGSEFKDALLGMTTFDQNGNIVPRELNYTAF